ncbi:hypothetical protein A2841_00130 [Candidatus Kaiserbacteria bacterium RIFCSPHIGHO2_01_FULL_48_10]|uniref:ATP synthase F1 complex delta/epsilon subunit N-terminal domain-containing protein n=1 Tax=Candidatus Kaiserbacteria bacterium RIFCSPHIGHO2_01_FULL_48_10 TaxID=1798476 RepID=A0A1F6C5N6_9BACT|nr:MAG: hypothetical protein A2841_00130 [Candidatus Kaiserbacteria bacterium RIFCSPHIGHO2_01_FULL_48_10]
MNVRVLTPDQTLFSGPVETVYVPAENGEVGILENHAPYAAALGQGIIELHREGKKREIPVTEGVLEVKENGEVVIFV